MPLLPYLQPLKAELEANAHAENAAYMKAYLRDRFEFYGIKKPVFRPIFRAHLKTYGLPEYSELEGIVRQCWAQPEREWHHFGQELAEKYVKRQAPAELLDLCEFMITHNSWWDSVDHIATKLVGPMVKRFPALKQTHIMPWSDSSNMWLQRTAILYQRDYKAYTDVDELLANILKVMDSEEFFLQKVVGWMLREYSKTDAEVVQNFVAQYEDRLSKLSKYEALRLLK